MVQNKAEARDKILTRVKAVTDAESLFVIYADTEKQPPVDGTEWARVTLSHAYGDRASFLSKTSGKARHRRGGILIVEIYTPLNDGQDRSDHLVQAFEEKFAEQPGEDVWYRNVHSVEAGTDGPWFHTNIVAEFEYDLAQ